MKFEVLLRLIIILGASTDVSLTIAGAKVIIYQGRRYHDKTIRTKYKGVLKPFALKIKNALADGSAIYKKTAGKCTYIYELK